MTFTVSYVLRDAVACLRLEGELDMAAAPELNAAIDRLHADGRFRLLADLAGLTFCDSSGLAAFVRGDNQSAAAGGWLRFTGAHGRVLRVLEISGLAEVLRYDGDPDMSAPTAPGDR
ncbi:STAS domain-containing protein [Micromonospora echinofusca]|uniref:Anti-sigma factor antagonist n=1 Tax=Micromonospora echinofusca TaxID=47858 RepID=A0ABS3VW93_MICEH|nr:STAS domain-containing protein [Micromonospora echinofusca]MBO4208810.1 anti-sigma factor antagonist [Micromonospora echinofusca]